jgi:ribosome-associated protein
MPAAGKRRVKRVGPHAGGIEAASDPGTNTGHDGDVLDVPISDDMIRLGQFLKLANLIDSGSDARILLEDGSVRVNGESERRRGRQLHRGDVVTVQGHQVRVV